jgi:hypothetical protein
MLEEWPDYPATYQLTAAHEAGLIAMASDKHLHNAKAKSSELWGPVHAWRALGQLRSAAAIGPLLSLLETLEDDDLAAEEIPTALGVIGPACLPAVAAILHDPGSSPEQVRSLLGALSIIGTRYPEARADCIDHLARTLADLDPALAVRNGLAVCSLLDLHATETIGLIRQAFANGAIDISIPGDLEDVEIDFGLREHRDTPKPDYLKGYTGGDFKASDDDDTGYAPAQQPIHVEKIGRNETCPCGSGKKYKKCCLNKPLK